MRAFVLCMFWLALLCFVGMILILANEEHPRVQRKSIGMDCADTFMWFALTVWAALALWN